MNITIFGWKREILSQYLNDCESISYNLAKDGNNIYTGGGGGFMRAANKGTFKYNPKQSNAISVKTIYGQEGLTNTYYYKDNFELEDTMKERKVKLFSNKDLYIYFPGGIGTLDEFMDLMNLFKTKEYKSKPVILYGKKYWSTLIEWFNINNMNFPHNFINGIVDTENEFYDIYNNLKK